MRGKKADRAHIQGSTLVWVLLVFIFLSALGAVLLTTSYSAFTNTSAKKNTQQAYFTARSAAQTMVKYLIQNASDDAKIAQVVNTSPPSGSDGASEPVVGTGTAGGMGNYLVSAWYTDATQTKIKVMARGTYAGSVSTLFATLNRTAGSAPDPNQNPLRSIVCVNGGTFSQTQWPPSGMQGGDLWADLAVGGSWTPQCTISSTGNIYINGTLNLTNGSLSAKRVMVNGNINMTNGRTLTGSLAMSGKLTVSASGTAVQLLPDPDTGSTTVPIDGGFDINNGGTVKANNGSTLFTLESAAKDLWETSGGTVTGNVITTKDAQMSGGTLKGSLTCGGNMLFDTWGGTITGALRYGSLSITQNTTVSRFVPGGDAAKNADAVSVASSSLPVSFANTLSVPQAPSVGTPPAGSITWGYTSWGPVSSCTITDDCVLTDSSQFGPYGNHAWNTNIYVNTAAKDKDINLIIKSGNFTLSQGTQILVSGPHRVFIYLVGNNASLTMNDNPCYIGMSDHSQSRIFIIGCGQSGSGQYVTMGGDSRIDGYLYLPYGTLNFASNGLQEGSTKCGLWGSATAQNVYYTGSGGMIYASALDANLVTGTGLDQVSYGTIPSSGGISFGGWSDS